MVSSIQIAVLSLGVAIISLIVSLVVGRISNLETRREREDYMNRRFEGRNWNIGPLKFDFDKLHIEQESGRKYKIKRYLFGSFDGVTELSVHGNVNIYDGFWESDDFKEIYSTSVESSIDMIYKKELTPRQTQYIFRIDSVDNDVVSKDMLALLKFLELSVENGRLSMEYY